jgi:Icc-related predicted phosphoesterase
LLVAAGVVVLAAAATVVAVYPGQTLSRLTHLTGSPRRTEPVPPIGRGPQPILRLAAVGDVGYSGPRIRATARAIASLAHERRYDDLLVLGDNVYPAGDPERLNDTVFHPFEPLLRAGTGMLAVLGNHDVMQGHADGQVEALGMPGRWYAVHLESVLVVALDSTQPRNPTQRSWLESTLRSATEQWRVVLVHHPPFSAGYQGSNLAARSAFTPLFERFGVQLVLSGHDHDYQRSKPINGVTYVVTGAASEARRTGRAEFTAFSASWHSFADVLVYPDRLVVRAVNQDARMFDQVAIRP